MEVEYVVGAVFVLVWIVGGFIAVKTLKRGLARDREAARGLAAALGLDFIEGEEAFRRAFAEPGQETQLAAFERMPAFLRKLSISMTSWRIEGERGGIRLAVYHESRGKNSTAYTVARAYLRTPLPYSLAISREGGAFKLGKALFGLADVELGDPELDPLVRIKAGDPFAAKLLLGGDEARRALLAAAQACRDFRATESFAHWEKRGTEDDPAVIGAALELLAPVARALGG